MRFATGLLALAVVLLGATTTIAEAKPKPWHRLLAQKGNNKAAPATPLVANCTLTEILATTEKKGIDPKLKKLEPKLTKPPFTSWDTFKLLGEPTAKAEKDKPTTISLATKGKLTLLLKDKIETRGGKARLRIGIDIDDKAGKRAVSTVMVFGTGEVHFPFVGEPYPPGVYILAINCTN
jgi:hypothetical protein